MQLNINLLKQLRTKRNGTYHSLRHIAFSNASKLILKLFDTNLECIWFADIFFVMNGIELFMTIMYSTFFSEEYLFVCLCFMSLQQLGHLETATPFTVPCEGREARQIHRFYRESNPGRRMAVNYATAAACKLHEEYKYNFRML